MKVESLKRKYTIETLDQWNEFVNNINKKAKKYLDIVISNGREEIIVKSLGVRFKKIEYGYRPNFHMITFKGTIHIVSYNYVLETLAEELMSHNETDEVITLM